MSLKGRPRNTRGVIAAIRRIFFGDDIFQQPRRRRMIPDPSAGDYDPRERKPAPFGKRGG